MNSRMETCQWTFECNYKSVGFFLAWPIANREMSVSKITLYTTGPNMQKESDLASTRLQFLNDHLGEIF